MRALKRNYSQRNDIPLLQCSFLCFVKKKMRFIILKLFFPESDSHHASAEKSPLFPFTLVKGIDGSNGVRFMFVVGLLDTELLPLCSVLKPNYRA